MKICKTENEYIEATALAVQKACKRYGYLPSVLIAQSCLENGYGIRSYWDNPQIEALLSANNMVGIKSFLLNDSWIEYTVWQGESITKKTPEEYNGKMVTITDNFRKYDSIERSFCDFLLFLKYASNYGKGGVPKYGDAVLAIKDPEQLIRTVAGKGYATGSTYPTSVMRILNKHNLTKYDDLSKVEPSMIVPDSLKLKYGLTNKSAETKTATTKKNNVIKLTSRTIKDITSENRSQVPASRNGNPIQFIVVHYLGVPNADNPYLYGGGYGGHYNIQRNGQIYKAANPKTAVVWHCGGGLQGSGGHEFHRICTNYNSIGIECGVCYTESVKDADGDSNKWYFTEETQESLVYLVSKLMDEYGISMDHVIRHYDVTGKICPNPYVKNNNLRTSWTWSQFKTNLAQYRKDGTITIPSGTTTTTVSTTPTTITTSKSYLAKGDSGKDVETLQTMLNACGYDCGTVDGDFGSKTDKAVRELQSATGLVVDGMYGAKTKGILEQMYKNTQALHKETESTISGTTYNGVDYSPVYNYSYYKKKYADLQKAFGNDKDAYFRHFCQYGMKEGRKAASSFDVQKYKAKYADLRKAFGDNLPEYYKHYCIYGKKEGRKAT